MTKTSNDVITFALREIGVVSQDATADASDYSTCKQVLDGLLAEVQASEGMTFTWTVEQVPDAAFIALGQTLAEEIHMSYSRPSPRNKRNYGLQRLRKWALPDDREDLRDLDDDGAISDDEVAAGKRAVYY